MANEIGVPFITAKTCYYLLRNSVNQIWNGATFENYNTANFANYPITATEQGTAGQFYVANMPAVAAGVYGLIMNQQVGVSPAETDFYVATGFIEWDGSAVLPLSGVPGTTGSSNVAASIFRRSMASDEAVAPTTSLCGAVLKLTSKFSVKDASNANLATVYRTDGVTVFMSQTPTVDATLVPTRSFGVGV